MQLRPDVALRATVKSLKDVVLPAVDAHNGPAVEQLQIAIGLIALVAERLPLEFRYDCDELERLLAFAHALKEVTAGDAPALESGTAEAQDVLDRAQASPADVLAAIRALRETTGAVVGAAYADGDPHTREQLSALVLAHAGEQLTRERAWLLPQGWEPAPERLPAIEDLVPPGTSAG